MGIFKKVFGKIFDDEVPENNVNSAFEPSKHADGKYPKLKAYLENQKINKCPVFFITQEEIDKWNVSKETIVYYQTITFNKESCSHILEIIKKSGEVDLEQYKFTIETLELNYSNSQLYFSNLTPDMLRYTNSNSLLSAIEESLPDDNDVNNSDVQMKLATNSYSIDEVIKISKLDNLNYNTWNLIGNSFRYYEKYDLAESAFLKSIELKKDNAEPYSNLQSLYLKIEDFEMYEDIYQKGMANAYPKYYIVYQDGRYQYQKGNYEMAYSAALEVLTAAKMQDEGAWILGVLSNFNMAREAENEEQKIEYYNQANDMLEKGLIVYPESAELKRLKSKYFED